MHDEWPTFDRCPLCGAMLWSNGDATWCSECDYFIEQAELDL